MAPALVAAVAAAHERVLGHPPNAPPRAAFYPYVSTKSTIRLREGTLHIRVSDHLADAPPPVLQGVAEVLIARLHQRRRYASEATRAYQAWIRDPELEARRTASRRERGRKHIDPAGEHQSLLASYLRVADTYELNPDPTPLLSWSKTASRRRFGHWDDDHGCIVISRALDDPEVPEFVLDYVVYHEVLHILYPPQAGSGHRRRVHTRAFRRAESRFEQQAKAEEWLTRLATIR